MSEEPARPEEEVGGGEAATGETGQSAAEMEAAAAEPPQVEQPNEPAQRPTIAQEPEMTDNKDDKLDPTPEETKPEKALEGQKDPSTPVIAKPGDAAVEFPLADDNVLAELKAGESRAREAAKAIEALKLQLEESAKKDTMTEEDIKNMEQKQKELMDKMQEFEDITKKIQQLVGLVDVASSQLGLPQKPLVPGIGGEKAGDPTKQPKSQPMDTLPKVIICGTSDVDQVPKIIVCEPTSARSGKHPLYHQTTGKTSDTKVSETKGPSDHNQAGTGTYLPGTGQAGMNQPGMGQAGINQPGMGQAGINQPGMGQAGMMQPGMGQYGMAQPGMGQYGMAQPGMGQYGMMQPGMGQPGMLQPTMGQYGMGQPGMGQSGMMQPTMGQAGMMQPYMRQAGMIPPCCLGQAGMMQPNIGQYGMAPPGTMPWTTQPGMMQYGTMQPSISQYGLWQPGALSQPGGQFMPGMCSPCEHPGKSQKSKDSKRENQNRPNNESEMKKSCRKKKQCYCQISGLCQPSRPPFPAT